MELELLKNYKLALKNSVEINEDNFTKKNNLSELAINSKFKAIEAEPKNINYWNSLFYVISVDRYLQCNEEITISNYCLLYTSPSPRDSCASRMPSSA